jgi:hypothetical protein
MDRLPDYYTLILVALSLGVVVLWIAWGMSYGIWRGTLATLCRVGWILPLFVSFFPETTTEQLPRALTLKPIHVLIDDSESMGGGPATLGGEPSVPAGTPAATADALVKELEAECSRLGCLPRVTRLSEQDDDARAGYTPLAQTLEAWLYKVGADPWVVVTDGGDERPSERWSTQLKGAGRPEAQPVPGGAPRPPRGLIVGFAPRDGDNVWIQDLELAPFSFEDKPLTLSVQVRRSTPAPSTERVQIQVLASDSPLATANAQFDAGEAKTSVEVTIPPLPKGQHLLSVRALPTASETALWDNTMHAQVEVLPNTVGVLHLLGSPSWDGRFLRRYLKAEPKYDLISFFILRDPWDSQQVNERELSLIPFPVERLFREELPNFRVVVIQNFTLFQFLLPEYQANLVKFVQDGGGLLFLGGPRALTAADLSSSPLRAILPFEVDDAELGPAAGQEFTLDDELAPMPSTPLPPGKGPGYDPDLEFTVELAKPDPQKRALANVYDDWEALAEPLTGWRGAKGLHHLERVRMKPDVTTTLLNAKVVGGGERRVPLAVASYPGKGRALWLFSDSLWRLGLTPSDTASRQVYNRFLQGAMTWLMRQDLRKPLVAKAFGLTGGRRERPNWRAVIQGPAARYFEPTTGTQAPEWKISVCGVPVALDTLTATRHGDAEWELTGPLPVNLAGGERCTLEVEGAHAAFGSVKASITGVFPEVFKDDELDAAPQKLEELAQLTGARLALPPADQVEATAGWLGEVTGHEGVSLPSRFKTLRNFYWILDRWWFWLLMALMPLEVVVRRWDQLFGGGRRNGDRGEHGDAPGAHLGTSAIP